MRDFFRLLVVGLLVVLIAGFALVYSRDAGMRHGLNTFVTNTWGGIGRTVTGLSGGDDVPMMATSMRIVRPQQASWVGLAGFPDQTAVRFPIPAAGAFTGGALDLHFDAQLATGGDGLLSISVNGLRRSEIVLNTGHNAYDVTIPLQASDLLAGHVVLTMAARGTTNSGQICPTDSANSGSAISLLPESALVLESLREINHPETALITMPDPLRIELGETEQAQATSIWAAQRMTRAGIEVVLVDDSAGLPAIRVTDMPGEAVAATSGAVILLSGRAGVDRTIGFRRADAAAPASLTDWPVSVSNLGTETVARNFRGSRRWTIPYRIADMPDGMMPTSFSLALRTSVLAEDFEWVVRVSLNGNLLHSARLPGQTADIALDIALPTHLQGLANAITVELIDTSPNVSICRAGPDAQAQLLAESRLLIGGPQPSTGWGPIVRRLATADFVTPGNHGLLDPFQATRAATMLAQFLPDEANVGFATEGDGMTITAITRDQLNALVAGEEDMPSAAWLVTDTGGSAINPLAIAPLSDPQAQALLARMQATDIAFIVQQAR